MPFRAKLDHDDIYWGESEEVAELAPSDPPVPDEAIRPGAYRWMAPDANHPQWRFAPLQPFEVKP